MADARALVRLVDELIWRLRRDGFDVAPSQAIDLARAVRAVGFDDFGVLREAVAVVVGPPPGERARFAALVAGVFWPDSAADAGTPWERLRLAGFTGDEVEALRRALEAVAARSPSNAAFVERILGGAAEFDRAVLISGVGRAIDASSELQLGHLAHRLLRFAGVDVARSALADLRGKLVAELGARGDALADAMAGEVDRADIALRAFVRRTYEARLAAQKRLAARGARAAPFASLDERQLDVVRRAFRAFAQRMASTRKAARRRGARGPVDPHRTLRASFGTGGAPLVLFRRRRRRSQPRVIVLCDVSDSVRPVARLFLELMYVLQKLFDRARTFVFVSDLGETTDLFTRERVADAVPLAWSGAGVVPTHDNSNYGRALRLFEQQHLHAVDRRTIVVVLGDGRTNRHDAAVDVLDRLRARSRALVWVCPEPRGSWILGDSAMALYAPKCTAVFEVACAEDLERAARALLRLGAVA
jgi:uncharacterized protein with von Willebrand factor type A (vWA) domain